MSQIQNCSFLKNLAETETIKFKHLPTPAGEVRFYTEQRGQCREHNYRLAGSGHRKSSVASTESKPSRAIHGTHATLRGSVRTRSRDDQGRHIEYLHFFFSRSKQTGKKTKEGKEQKEGKQSNKNERGPEKTRPNTTTFRTHRAATTPCLPRAGALTPADPAGTGRTFLRPELITQRSTEHDTRSGHAVTLVVLSRAYYAHKNTQTHTHTWILTHAFLFLVRTHTLTHTH